VKLFKTTQRLFKCHWAHWDDEWCGETLVNHFVAKGTVIGIGPNEPTPNEKYWEEVTRQIGMTRDDIDASKYREALAMIARKAPEKVNREEAADMACEFKALAVKALASTKATGPGES
jgi:hypothetical protein